MFIVLNNFMYLIIYYNYCIFCMFFFFFFYYFFFFFFFFFFKQKTAYEIVMSLEFRHVLFRSRYVELVRGSRVRLRPHADPSGGAWRPAAVRAGNQGADGVRGVGGNGSGVRPGPGAHRPGRRAAGASRGDPHRARVDRARGADRAAVNVYFHTFGCKANQYDTALVRQAFADQGVVVVDDPAAADLAVVNSCTVTHESEAKLGRLVRRLARQNGRLETVVMGCAAALDNGRIAGLPSVRAVVGGAEPARVLRAAGLSSPAGKSGVETEPGTSGVGDPRAHGRGQSTLGDLLAALISAVPQVRFRLSSIEATEVDDTIARLLIEAPAHLAAHLHAPLQSGANRILKRMGRHWYTAESYRARLDWLAERLPVFGLGADIIAGFPGESDAEHRQTIALVDALPFTYLHVFPYSERPGAAAGRLGERVPPGIIRERARELRERGEAKARAHRVRRLGQRADGVVCGRGEGKVEVLTEDYLSVYLPAQDWNGRLRFEVTVS